MEMGDRARPEVRKAEQRGIRRLAHLTDCLEAFHCHNVPDSPWKSNQYERRIVRKFGCAVNLAHFFAFSPSSTSRRIASERLGPSGCREAQASTLAMNWSESLNVRVGSVPVAGRPAPVRFPPALLCVAFFMGWYYVIQGLKTSGLPHPRQAGRGRSTFGRGDGSLAD
jgi:hypothetical protein